MKAYLLQTLRDLYLLYFWPTQFKRDVEDSMCGLGTLTSQERLQYIVSMLPWILTLAGLCDLASGIICTQMHVFYSWPGSGFGLGFGLILGIAFVFLLKGGLAISVLGCLAVTVATSVALGIAGGAVFSVEGAVVLGLTSGVPEQFIFFPTLIVLLIAAFSITLGIVSGVAEGIIGGIVGGLPLCILGAIVGGLVAGIRGSIETSAASLFVFLITYFRVFSYPTDTILSIVLYFVAIRRPRDTIKMWFCCPVYWNEVIWMPLPYTSKLLALLVRQDRDEGFRQIAFVSAERKLRRRSALRALAEVVIEDIRNISIYESSDLSAKLSWPQETISVMPPGLTEAVRRLDAASRSFASYQVLNNAYRRSEALTRAIQEVEALQRGLIAMRAKFAPQLMHVANEWRTLLEAKQKELLGEIDTVMEIPNPFIFGNPIIELENGVFAGRSDIVRHVEDSILGVTQVPTLLLHGPRRMGKTSILRQLPRLLGPDFAPSVVDCQNPAIRGSAATILRHFSRALSDGLRVRRVIIQPLSATELAREPFGVFGDWLDTMEHSMPQTMRALLCLDEYESLNATLHDGWGDSLLDTLRHTLQHKPRIILMFSGVHTFAELGPEWTGRFISARRVRVSFLTHEEVIPLLTKPIPEFDMTYAPGALEALIAATNGQPFLTQAVAFELVQHMNEQRRKEATPDDIEIAIARALESGGEYFANVWTDAKPEGQGILTALAAGGPPPRRTAANKWLWEHDVLNESGAFAVPMVERWVRERTAEG